MNRQWCILLLGCLLVPAACREEPAPAALADPPPANIAPSPAPTIGSIGPIEYRFDPQRVSRAELQLAIPPGFTTTVWGIKLIPADRASELGENRCRYGKVEKLQACTVEEEDGLAMALLERPIADYRAAFAEAGIHEADLQASVISDRQGFRFTTPERIARTTYGFYPAGERTLLLAKRFSPGREELDPAIADALDSLRFPPQFEPSTGHKRGEVGQ